MQLPQNRFKRALAEDPQQIGLWCSLPSAFAAEIVAPAGFNWLSLDTEHSPSSVPIALSQLQAVAPYGISPVVRPATNDPVLIKRFLDIGAKMLLLPYVQSAEEARRAVLSMRYPPESIRGVSGLTRATRFGRVDGHFRRAAEELCLLVQVEIQAALDDLEAITTVDGVDGVFIGPADLAASLGHPSEPNNPAVQNVVLDTIQRIRAFGKPAGILSPDTAFAQRCIDAGRAFTSACSPAVPRGSRSSSAKADSPTRAAAEIGPARPKCFHS